MATTTTDPAKQTTTATTTGTEDEAGRIQSIEQIQREQREQRGMLEQLLGRLPAPGKVDNNTSPAPQGGGTSSTAGLDIGQIQTEVRRQIDEADQRREADKKERDWREEVTQVVERVKQEQQPREQQTGVRAALRRALIGKDT
jgi:hypothetical protein